MDSAKTRSYNPSQILVFGSALIILIGALLLMTPYATESGEPLPPVDALFTATSAVSCGIRLQQRGIRPVRG